MEVLAACLVGLDQRQTALWRATKTTERENNKHHTTPRDGIRTESVDGIRHRVSVSLSDGPIVVGDCKIDRPLKHLIDKLFFHPIRPLPTHSPNHHVALRRHRLTCLVNDGSPRVVCNATPQCFPHCNDRIRKLWLGAYVLARVLVPIFVCWLCCVLNDDHCFHWCGRLCY